MPFKNLDYQSFAETCAEELTVLQNRFKDQYDVDWYNSWFYNQSTGLLTFSTGEVEINFKYVDVGSFSNNSHTWKWSWDNDTTLEKVKEKINIVRSFGEKSNYEKLITGTFPSDEYEAWEFTAIAAKLINGIGVYRPVTEKGLQIYFVVTEFVDNETAKQIKQKYVECRKHEYNRVAFVCKHLIGKDKVGFNEAFDTYEDMELEEDDDFQAWCDECEAVRQEEGEWNERSMAFADIKLVCEKCYFEIKALNLDEE